MNGNASCNTSFNYSGKSSADAERPSGAMQMINENSISIACLEKAIEGLSERLVDVLGGDVRSIGSAGAEKAPSMGSTICDALFSNDARVREAASRIENLTGRLRL